MAKRTKKKLTSNQAWVITSLICGAIIFGEFILFLNLSDTLSRGQNTLLLISSLILSILLFAFLFFIVFKIPALERKEATDELLNDLSKSDFTQVYLNIETDEIIQLILQNEECKFFAKLTEDNNIVIIAKDKYDKEVYKEEVGNPLYFYDHFKV